MTRLSYLFFWFCFLLHCFVFAQMTEETASSVVVEFILSENLDDTDFTSSDWKNAADIFNQYGITDETKRFLDYLKSKGLHLKSILNLIQSPDYLQIHKDINASFFNISQSELKDLEKQTEGETSAADTFFNFVSNLLIGSHTDEEAVMGRKMD